MNTQALFENRYDREENRRINRRAVHFPAVQKGKKSAEWPICHTTSW